MKRLFLIPVLCLLFSACGEQKRHSGDDPLGEQATTLLYSWLDGLGSQQLVSDYPALDGGMVCPACARIHGRCGDAILPLMYAARKTGNKEYVESAIGLWNWMDTNASLADGSWANDINISDWNGTTVFAVISIGEALLNYGDLLPEETRDRWWKRLERAGEYILGADMAFSRRRQPGWKKENINYSASAPYALWILGTKLGRQDFLDKGAQIAGDMRDYFSPNNCLLFGEGPVMGPSPKNGYSVDVGYNVEESLPNLALYAKAAGDSVLFDLVGRSMLSHLEFMLPDGAWDNSWGTRSFKWTYWGSRTSDGMMPGYQLYVDRYPAFRTAIARNIDLLAKATHEGMLYGGMDYKSNGQPPCNHHSFSHARGLAAFLMVYQQDSTPLPALPRDKEYGIKYIPDARAWLVSQGNWRATITDLDAEYRVRATHPKGGALSMLWHKDAGPLFAAGMNAYVLIEPTNMQVDRQIHTMSPSPRVELIVDGKAYNSIDDSHAEVKCVDGRIESICSLVDAQGANPPSGAVRVALGYGFEAGVCTLSASLLTPAEGVRMVLPLITASGLKYETSTNQVTVHGPAADYGLKSSSPLHIAPVNASGRILGFTPGFEFIPVVIPLEGSQTISMEVIAKKK